MDAVLQTDSVWISLCRNFTRHDLNLKNLFHIGEELQFYILQELISTILIIYFRYTCTVNMLLVVTMRSLKADSDAWLHWGWQSIFH